MRAYVYRAEFERGARRSVVASFPDVPEAITQGRDMADVRAMAEEALGRWRSLCYPDARRAAARSRVTKGDEPEP